MPAAEGNLDGVSMDKDDANDATLFLAEEMELVVRCS
jgi:hypothetical protein